MGWKSLGGVRYRAPYGANNGRGWVGALSRVRPFESTLRNNSWRIQHFTSCHCMIFSLAVLRPVRFLFLQNLPNIVVLQVLGETFKKKTFYILCYS